LGLGCDFVKVFPGKRTLDVSQQPSEALGIAEVRFNAEVYPNFGDVFNGRFEPLNLFGAKGLAAKIFADPARLDVGQLR
jgi:hypothetical protein